MATRPVPPTAAELCEAEKRGFYDLAPAGLLHLKTRDACPFPELRKFIVQYPPGSPQERQGPYAPCRLVHRRYDFNEAFLASALQEAVKGQEKSKLVQMSAEIKQLQPAFLDLENELRHHIGDDVLTATIFPPATAATTNLTATNTNNDDDGDDAEQQNTATATSATAPPPPRTFTINNEGNTYTVPLSPADCEALYSYGTESKFGLELDDGGDADVHDEEERKSTEYLIKDLQLPNYLQNPRDILAAFPELVHDIILRLAPTADKIAIIPYKLVCYKAPDDHFRTHVDTLSDPRHFATMAIHLPTQADYAVALAAAEAQQAADRLDPRLQQLPEEFSYNSGERSASLVVPMLSVKEIRKQYGSAAADGEGESGEDEEQYEANGNTEFQNSRAIGGALRFYLGRSVAAGAPAELLDNRGQNSYELPRNAATQFCAQVIMQAYTADELTGKSKTPSRTTASKFSSPPLPQDQEDKTTVTTTGKAKTTNGTKQPGAAAAAASSSTSAKSTTSNNSNNKNKKLERTHLPLHVAVWNTDVPHSVRKLRSGYRFVLTYKILRQGDAMLRIPRFHIAVSKLERFAHLIVSVRRQVEAVARQPHEFPQRSLIPKSFGFLCRHLYGPKALETPNLSLKGLDAIAYRVMSASYKAAVVPVFAVRDLTTAAAFNVERAEHDGTEQQPRVFMTAQFRPNFGFSSDAVDELMFVSPIIVDTCFIPLGLGEVQGQAQSMGNASCGADWWYRQCAIVSTMQDGAWRRRRVLFLVVAKGASGNVWSESLRRCEKFYPIWRNIAYFL